MNKLQKFLFGAASVLLLAGCSDEFGSQRGKDSDDKNGPGVYMGVNFKMPGMGETRSFTNGENQSSGGVEVGTDIENNVNEVMLILARADDYGFIGAASVLRNNLQIHTDASTKNPTYHALAKFNRSELHQYYEDNSITSKGNVAVFVIVNPTGTLQQVLEAADYGNKEWLNTAKNVTVDANGQTEGSIWSNTNGGHFLMSNSQIAIRKIPVDESGWDNYTTEDKCFNLSSTNAGVGGTLLDNSVAGNGGPVYVERAAARMDFRDGSPEDTEANTYHVVYVKKADGTNDPKQPIIDVTLNKMCLVNMSKSFYYLKRVSDNGLPNGAGFQICGPEMPWFQALGGSSNLNGNYVVDVFANEMAAGIDKNFSNYFNYAFFDNDGLFNVEQADAPSSRWYVSLISDVLKGENDNYEGNYKVWRYLTENTIPGIDRQKNGISTGIVFKGRMSANTELLVDLTKLTEGSAEYKNAKRLNDLINTINNERKDENGVAAPLTGGVTDPILYAYAGNIYVSWQSIYDAAIEASLSLSTDGEGKVVADWNRTNSLYKAVFGGPMYHTGYTTTVDGHTYTDSGDLDPESANYAYNAWASAGKPENQLMVAYKKAVTDAKITIYETSIDPQEPEGKQVGYYCYYYYWNRHNDNGKDGIMGEMEFAVVRNNVYKLAVTNIAKLGHPRVSSNDPDNPTPDTDDETSDVYLTVDAEVIPWVVRINDIKFE